MTEFHFIRPWWLLALLALPMHRLADQASTNQSQWLVKCSTPASRRAYDGAR